MKHTLPTRLPSPNSRANASKGGANKRRNRSIDTISQWSISFSREFGRKKEERGRVSPPPSFALFIISGGLFCFGTAWFVVNHQHHPLDWVLPKKKKNGRCVVDNNSSAPPSKAPYAMFVISYGICYPLNFLPELFVSYLFFVCKACLILPFMFVIVHFQMLPLHFITKKPSKTRTEGTNSPSSGKRHVFFYVWVKRKLAVVRTITNAVGESYR